MQRSLAPIAACHGAQVWKRLAWVIISFRFRCTLSWHATLGLSPWYNRLALSNCAGYIRSQTAPQSFGRRSKQTPADSTADSTFAPALRISEARKQQGAAKLLRRGVGSRQQTPDGRGDD